MDYTTISLADVRQTIDAVAAEAEAAFGPLTAPQLNWKPEPSRWSVAQCLEHLVTGNAMMFRQMDRALQAGGPEGLWQRLPGWPRLAGRLLIRAVSPDSVRRHAAPRVARPSASDLPADILSRFLAQQREAGARLSALDDRAAARAIMTSPFAAFIPYSVLDGWRVIAAHERRHVAQARRVTQAPGFPW